VLYHQKLIEREESTKNGNWIQNFKRGKVNCSKRRFDEEVADLEKKENTRPSYLCRQAQTIVPWLESE
jgi:hypothetical protein